EHSPNGPGLLPKRPFILRLMGPLQNRSNPLPLHSLQLARVVRGPSLGIKRALQPLITLSFFDKWTPVEGHSACAPLSGNLHRTSRRFVRLFTSKDTPLPRPTPRGSSRPRGS